MKNFTLAALAILGLSTSASAADRASSHPEMQQLWSQWKDTHSKSYSEAEDARRLEIFAENYNKIVAHNAKDSTVTLGINQFSDLTGDEWKAQYAGGFLPHNRPDEDANLPDNEDKRFLGSLPSSIDWRQKGAVGPVKNQKSCKGCWAFAAAGALESLNYIKTGNLLSFSEQQLLDCDKSSHGCNAGHTGTAFSYTAQNGIELESEYPFKEATQSCKYNSGQSYHVNKGHSSVRANNAQALKSAVVNQPVAVGIEANQSVFQHYKSGVITSGCGASTDHAVLVVGYTTVNGQEAFIVKNSYGANWGQSGYVYISTNGSANGGKGVCGILQYPGYPTA